YLRYAEKIYKIDAKILLQDEKQASGDLAGLAELASLAGGGSQTSAFVSDQIDVIKSRRILRKVIETNKLNVTYKSQGKVKSSELLEKQSPIKIVLLDPNNSSLDSVSYELKLALNEGKIKLIDEHQVIENYSFGKKFITPIGAVMLVPNSSQKLENNMVIKIDPIQKVIDILL